VLRYEQGAEGLTVYLPDAAPCKNAFVLKISNATGAVKNL
jgi:hypothetical protein